MKHHPPQAHREPKAQVIGLKQAEKRAIHETDGGAVREIEDRKPMIRERLAAAHEVGRRMDDNQRERAWRQDVRPNRVARDVGMAAPREEKRRKVSERNEHHSLLFVVACRGEDAASPPGFASLRPARSS